MKLYINLILLAILLQNYALSQGCQWAQKVSNAHSELNESAIANFSDGAYIVAGYAPNNDSLKFNNGVVIKDIQAGDLYLAAYSSEGNCRWVKIITSPNFNSRLFLRIDSDRNIYFAGNFRTSVIRFSPNVELYSSNENYNEGFIAKYDYNGECAWAKRIGGAGNDLIHAFELDSEKNIYIAGSFMSYALNFGDNIQLKLKGWSDAFFVKVDSTGAVLAANRIGDIDLEEARAIAFDDSANIYIAGVYVSDSLKMSENEIIRNNGLRDVFLAKYSPEGAFKWIRGFGGSKADYVSSIACAKNGEIYLTGNYQSEAIKLNDNIIISNGGYSDSYIIKYAAEAEPLWAKNIDGDKDEISKDIKIGNNALFICGNSNSVYSNFSSNVYIASKGEFDGFIAKYNFTGACQWAQNMGGASNDYINGISLGNDGSINISGWFASSLLRFNNLITVNASALQYGNNGYFFAKYIDGLNSIKNSYAEKANIAIFPNPCADKIEIELNEFEINNLSVEIFNSNGVRLIEYKYPILNDKNIIVDIDDLPNGVFYIIIKNRIQSISKQFVKIK